MIQYRIWTENYAELFQIKLDRLLESPDSICGSWQCDSLDTIKCFRCAANKKEKDEVLKNIANLVGDVIQEGVLKKFARSYLKSYKGLNREEKKEVEKLFIHNNYIAKEEGVSYIAYYVIYTPLIKELERYKEVNIDGWMAFRTQKYKVILEDVIEQTIYDYEMQKDYIQFINFLLDTKSMQEAKEEVMHLIPKEEGDILLLDEYMQDRTKAYMQQYCNELEDEKMQIEDKVLHILICVSPKKVIIHKDIKGLNPHFLDTLKALFKEQLSYCDGCENCQSPL